MCIRDREDNDLDLWLCNGGSLSFYGHALNSKYFLEAMPFYAIRGDYLFVHAGVMPGVPLIKQKKKDLTWIRDRFLNAEDHGLPFTIVHGHSITEDFEVDVQPKRINIDTGAFCSGKLTALPLEYEVDVD